MKKPIFHYTFLAILFGATVVFQVARVRYLYPQWFQQTHAIQAPFVLAPTPQGFMVGWTSDWARQAGIQPGEVLDSINARALTGLIVFGQAVAAARPGDVLKLTVQPQRAHRLLPEQTVSLVMPQAAPHTLFTLLLYVVAPAFCIGLGFWVAAVRIRDPLAWLLLALMLGFAAVAYPSTELWNPRLAGFGTIYYAGLTTTWPIWMLLFGIHFPEGFHQRSWQEFWEWIQWIVIIPLAFFSVIHIIISLGAINNYLAVRSLLRMMSEVGPAVLALMAVGVVGFFACIGLKLRLASSQDARRRLRLLSTGTVISLLPISTLFLISWLNGWVLGSHFPDGMWIAAFLLTFLFPVTLGYVIVVERAMDVRVVVRRGLRYAFAKSGLNAIQVAFGIGLIAAVISILRRLGPYSLWFYLVIALAVLLSVETRHAFRKLRLWIDRKFFRDAYNAEQILSELGDQVRSMVEPRPLLERVCRSIADSLHVPQIAVLLQNDGAFKPAYALGYSSLPDVSFSHRASTVEQMRQTGEPVSVYFDDPDSWVYWRNTCSEERAGLQALRSQLLLPLAANEKLLGFVSLGEKRSEEPYSGSDVRLLKSVASQAGLALENAQLITALAREAAQRERLNRELEIAREVQERLFPQKLTPVPGLDYCGFCRPALGVAGDYYDFLALPGGKLGVAIADVCGKGISAALTMATLHAWMRGEAARADADLSLLVSNISRLLFEASASNRYATLFYARYDPSSRALSFVNAGHNPPLLLKQSNSTRMVEKLTEGGTVVGIFEQVSYHQACEVLEAGSLLVAYTDGITEAVNRDGEEWGEERLVEAIRHTDGLSACEIARHVFAAVDAFAAGTEQHDDMTLVVLRSTNSELYIFPGAQR